jgi:hypothetical protein
MFRSLIKDNGVKFPDRSQTSFNETLGKFKEYTDLSEVDRSILYEYYLLKLKEK